MRHLIRKVGFNLGGFFFFWWRCSLTRAMASSFTRFLDHTQRRITVGRTPLDEWSARRRDLYLTTHNTHNWQTSVPPVGFEPTISAGERPQTYALDRAATGTGFNLGEVSEIIKPRTANYWLGNTATRHFQKYWYRKSVYKDNSCQEEQVTKEKWNIFCV